MENERPNCLKCKHYYVTWDPQLPRGCKAFGLKSKDLPSQVVRRNSGKECVLFEQKARGKKEGLDLNSDDLW